MSKTRMLGVSLLLLLIGAMVAVACGDSEEVIVERTVVVEVEKIVEKTVEVEVAAERMVLGETVGEPEFEFHVLVGAYPHPFWEVYKQGTLDAGNDFNVKVVFHMQPEHSNEDQANRVDQVRALNPDGLLVSINEVASMDGPARRAIEAGIPIIATNSADPRSEDERIPYLFYIGQSEILAGEVLAREALKFRPNARRAAMGMMLPGHVVFEARRQGLLNVFEERGIPFDMIDVTFDPTVIKERMRAHFTANPDIDIWITGHVDPHVVVGVEFFKETGRKIGGSDGVNFWTWDINEDGIQAVRDGDLLGMVDQQIYMEGYLGIQWLFLFKKWGFVPAQDLLTGPRIVNIDNIDIVEESVKAGFRR